MWKVSLRQRLEAREDPSGSPDTFPVIIRRDTTREIMGEEEFLSCHWFLVLKRLLCQLMKVNNLRVYAVYTKRFLRL